MKKHILLLLTILSVTIAGAQESKEVYSFLRLPVSAHAAALGGDNITFMDDDPTVIFHIPPFSTMSATKASTSTS